MTLDLQRTHVLCTYATTTNLSLRIQNSESQLASCGSDVFSCLTVVKCVLRRRFDISALYLRETDFAQKGLNLLENK
jgi:hypothetical protein